LPGEKSPCLIRTRNLLSKGENYNCAMEKLKIALVIDVFEGVNGGAERQVYEFLKRFDRDRFEPYLFVAHQTDIPREVQSLRVPASGLGIKRIYDFDGISKGFTFTRLLKEGRVDIVLTYHFSSDIWGAFFARLAKVPVIVSSRRDIGFWRNRTHIQAYKLVNRWVSRIIAVSNAVKEMVVREEGVAPEKVETVHNGVCLDVPSEKASLGFADGDFVVGCVANFSSKTKGHEVLVDAARKAVDEAGEKFKLLLVGDGPLRQRINLQVMGHNLQDNVLFAGKRSDVKEVLQACDMCVLPSLSEGLSNALLEYMAAGKPVVATAVGGNPEVISDRENGLLVPAGESAALARAMIEVFRDKDFAQELGSAGRRTVENCFDLSKQLNQLQDILAETVRGRKV